jgi:homoserine/homoserine lactone efflux protein
LGRAAEISMSVEAWALFCLTEFVLCLNPGPSALVVVSQSLTRGPSAGVRVTLGVIAANAIYFGASASGLIALHALSAEAFSIIKWFGAAYLAFLGVNLVRSSLKPPVIGQAIPTSSGSPFLRGFVTQGANPNLLVYFTAILPQFINPAHAVAPQVALLACSSFIIESAVLSAYAGLSGYVGEATAPRFRTLLERIGGGLLIGAAAGLARLERE